MSVDSEPLISIITVLEDVNMIPLVKENYKNIKYKNKQIIIVDDGEINNISKFLDIENSLYLHLNQEEKEELFKKIREADKNPSKEDITYSELCNKLPMGFKRDYGCGFSDGEYMLHMNSDCIYNAKTIDRKLRLLKDTGSECIYCDTVLCYDIYGKELYKSKSENNIYESTLFHTAEFWKRRGFNWSECENEGKYFHYNNGVDKLMDNYYDTIQLLTINNMNMYNPIRIELNNMKIDIPDCVSEINIKDHPMKLLIDRIFKSDGKILGINSEFLDNVELPEHNVRNIVEKWKQTKLAKLIGEKEYDCLLFGSKHPAWSLFNEVSFKVIFLETTKNFEQMDNIILTSKINKYKKIKGIYINQSLLKTNDPTDVVGDISREVQPTEELSQ